MMQQMLIGMGGLKSVEQIELLVVAGGGGGGGSYSPGSRVAGGGGAGGYLYHASYSLAGSPLQITVGTGGNGGVSSPGLTPTVRGSSGTDSSFGTVIATGGGGGGTGQNPTIPSDGLPGGSGGGSGHDPSQPAPYQGGGTGVGGQGNRGGDGDFRGGGGGGAGGQGFNIGIGPITPDATPYGGSGVFNSITGSPVGYAGGGSAGNNPTTFPSGLTYGPYGQGAGGASVSSGSPALDGTGSGGGGGAHPRQGGNGASGIVIIAYPIDFRELTIPGGLTYTTPSRSGMYVYRFTAGSGTVSF